MKDDIEFDVFLHGETINLIVLDENMVNSTNWHNWFNDEYITFGTSHHYFPNTREDQKRFLYDDISSNQNKLQLGIVFKEKNLLIGVLSLNEIDFLNQKCEISVMIGDKNYHFLKPLIESHNLLINHAFQQLNMNKVYMGTMSIEVAEIFKRFLFFSYEGTLKS